MSPTPTHMRPRKEDLGYDHGDSTTQNYSGIKKDASSGEKIRSHSPKHSQKPLSNYNAHARAKSTSALKDKPRRRRHEAYDKRSRSVHPLNVSREIDRPVWRLKSYGTEDPNLASFYTDSRRLFEEYDAWVSGQNDEENNDTHIPHNLTHRQMSQPSTVATIHTETVPEEPNVEREDCNDNYDYSNNLNNIDDNKVETNQIYDALKPTVIEWTSPTTRRREYAKIDRSTHGIRGFWRRFAPACCQASDAPMPFYDSRHHKRRGRRDSEGSVRRFRMDIADEDEQEIDEFQPNHDEKGLPHSFLSRLSQAESTLSSSWKKFKKHNDLQKKIEPKRQATACF